MRPQCRPQPRTGLLVGLSPDTEVPPFSEDSGLSEPPVRHVGGPQIAGHNNQEDTPMNELYLRALIALTMPRDKSERGATAVEYGLMVALIAGVIIAVVGLLGTDVMQAFDSVENAILGNDG